MEEGAGDTLPAHERQLYFALLDKSAERIEDGLPVFHVKSLLLGDRLVSIPFATLCDPLVSSKTENAQPIMEESDGFPNHVFKHHVLQHDQPLEMIYGRFNRNVRRSCRCAQTFRMRLRENGTRTAALSAPCYVNSPR